VLREAKNDGNKQEAMTGNRKRMAKRWRKDRGKKRRREKEKEGTKGETTMRKCKTGIAHNFNFISAL